MLGKVAPRCAVRYPAQVHAFRSPSSRSGSNQMQRESLGRRRDRATARRKGRARGTTYCGGAALLWGESGQVGEPSAVCANAPGAPLDRTTLQRSLRARSPITSQIAAVHRSCGLTQDVTRRNLIARREPGLWAHLGEKGVCRLPPRSPTPGHAMPFSRRRLHALSATYSSSQGRGASLSG